MRILDTGRTADTRSQVQSHTRGSQCVRACVHAQLLSCVRLFVTLWTVVRQAPLSMGFWKPEQVAAPSSRRSSWPRNGPCISWIAGGFLTSEPLGKPPRVWPQTNRISYSSGTCEQGTLSGPIPDTLNQKLWEWGPAIPPGDPDARQSLRTTDLLISRICHVSVSKQLSFIMTKDSIDLGRGSHVLVLVFYVFQVSRYISDYHSCGGLLKPGWTLELAREL